MAVKQGGIGGRWTRKETQPDLRATSPAINGRGRRRYTSWIDGYIEHTANLESPEIGRKWEAIGMIAAVQEQKVWVDTGSLLYPNLYIFLVGQPGTGKSRAIIAASGIIREAIAEVHWGATSMT